MCDVTHLLLAIERGEAGAAEKLLRLVYAELRRIGHPEARAKPPGRPSSLPI